jgi:hypothetical protein
MIAARLAVLACVALSIPFIAQQPAQGHLDLTVRDQSGAIIPHPEVKIFTVSGSRVVWHFGDTAGNFSYDLPAGHYALSVAAEGFSKSQQEIEVHSGAPQALSVTLKFNEMMRCGPCVTDDPVFPYSDVPFPFETAELRLTIPLAPLRTLEHLKPRRPRK